MTINANRIINVTADGSWQTVPNIARHVERITIQARTSVAVSYRWTNNTTEQWTIKADTVRDLTGNFGPLSLEIQANNGTIIEIECSVSRLG